MQLKDIPSKIAYSTLTITTSDGETYPIPRRELFDVRLQLMAEDERPGTANQTTEHALTDLGDEDIRTNVYEGGMKSWECSVDLAKKLLEDPGHVRPPGDVGLLHVLEVCADYELRRRGSSH